MSCMVVLHECIDDVYVGHWWIQFKLKKLFLHELQDPGLEEGEMQLECLGSLSGTDKLPRIKVTWYMGCQKQTYMQKLILFSDFRF